jgi:hypothetical protein
LTEINRTLVHFIEKLRRFSSEPIDFFRGFASFGGFEFEDRSIVLKRTLLEEQYDVKRLAVSVDVQPGHTSL